MGKLLKGMGVTGGCLLLLCICLGLITLRSCGSIGWTWEPADPYPTPDPTGATCDNVGVTYPDNPFSGWPQAGRGVSDINYYYCAADYYQIFGRTHWGIDIDATHREAIYATGTANVLWAYEDTLYGMGRNVKVCSPNGWCALYMHLDEWTVVAGQSVVAGDQIGYADNTGNSTGTHLHYQINDAAGNPVDPFPTLP